MFNANVPCRIFLDAVRDRATKTVEDYARLRLAKLRNLEEDIDREMHVSDVDSGRLNEEAIKEQENAKLKLQERKKNILQQQEELSIGISKYKDLMSTDVSIDLLSGDDASTRMNVDDESNAKRYAIEILKARNVYLLCKVRTGTSDGQECDVTPLNFSTTLDPSTDS